MSGIHMIKMPKWGLSMKEAKVNGWLKEVGDSVTVGEEIAEVESEKIAGTVEAAAEGVLRRQLAQVDDVLPVGGLLGIVADSAVPDAEIDAAVTEFLASFTPEVAEEEAAGPQPEKVKVGDRSLRYLKRGEGGKPAILIHGFGGDLNNWLFNHEALAANCTVYALDLPGHGESTKDVGDGSLDELATAVTGFMDALGISSAHLVGHSMGGAVSLAIAKMQPERVHSLAVISSAGLGSEINGAYIEGFVSAAKPNALKPHLKELFADPGLVTRQLVDDMMKYKRLEGVDAALRKLASTLFPSGTQSTLLRDVLTASRKPALVIWGADDRIIPVAHADLPQGARVEIIPAKGHMVQMEAAHEVNHLIGSFWS